MIRLELDAAGTRALLDLEIARETRAITEREYVALIRDRFRLPAGDIDVKFSCRLFDVSPAQET